MIDWSVATLGLHPELAMTLALAMGFVLAPIAFLHCENSRPVFAADRARIRIYHLTVDPTRARVEPDSLALGPRPACTEHDLMIGATASVPSRGCPRLARVALRASSPPA